MYDEVDLQWLKQGQTKLDFLLTDERYALKYLTA